MKTINKIYKTNIVHVNSMILLGAVGALFLLASCGNDDDPIVPPNEEELITTLNMTFTPVDGSSDPLTIRFFDEDGADGRLAPEAGMGVLMPNTAYNVVLSLLNESETPIENITMEILEEAENHQFFFSKTEGLDISFDYADMDDDGNPIGVATLFTTGDVSSGQLGVILRHEPDKNAAGVNEGSIANAGGETDIETTPAFDIVIK